jgi:hypothetical protein
MNVTAPCYIDNIKFHNRQNRIICLEGRKHEYIRRSDEKHETILLIMNISFPNTCYLTLYPVQFSSWRSFVHFFFFFHVRTGGNVC